MRLVPEVATCLHSLHMPLLARYICGIRSTVFAVRDPKRCTRAAALFATKHPRLVVGRRGC